MQNPPPAYNPAATPETPIMQAPPQGPQYQPPVYYQGGAPAPGPNAGPTQPLMQQGNHPHFGLTPQRHTCQFCGNNIVTHVDYEAGTLTWLTSGGLCLVGCVLGCCLIPFMVDELKDPVHHCPHCHHVVGRKSRI